MDSIPLTRSSMACYTSRLVCIFYPRLPNCESVQVKPHRYPQMEPFYNNAQHLMHRETNRIFPPHSTILKQRMNGTVYSKSTYTLSPANDSSSDNKIPLWTFSFIGGAAILALAFASFCCAFKRRRQSSRRTRRPNQPSGFTRVQTHGTRNSSYGNWVKVSRARESSLPSHYGNIDNAAAMAQIQMRGGTGNGHTSRPLSGPYRVGVRASQELTQRQYRPLLPTPTPTPEPVTGIAHDLASLPPPLPARAAGRQLTPNLPERDVVREGMGSRSPRSPSHTLAYPPSVLIAGTETRLGNRRAGSVESIGSFVTTASWEGRMRTPPPNYWRSAGDKIHIEPRHAGRARGNGSETPTPAY
jgi:hypothetical protein